MNNNEKMKAVFEVLKNGFDNLKANGEVGIKFSLEKEFENSLGCIYVDNNFDIIEKDLQKALDRTLKYIATKELDADRKTEFPEILKEYKEYADSIKSYSDKEKYKAIENSEVLSTIKDLEFPNGFQNVFLQIDTELTKDYDNSRWYFYVKEDKHILKENDINKIGTENIANFFSNDEKAKEYLLKNGIELKEVKNFKLVEEKEQNSFYEPSRSNNGGGYHQPYQKYEFELDGKEYNLVYDDTSCGEFGARFNLKIFEKENSANLLLELNVDEVKQNSKDYINEIYANEDLLTEEMWYNLTNNRDISEFLSREDYTYNELIGKEEFGEVIREIEVNNSYYEPEEKLENNLMFFELKNKNKNNTDIKTISENFEEAYFVKAYLFKSKGETLCVTELDTDLEHKIQLFKGKFDNSFYPNIKNVAFEIAYSDNEIKNLYYNENLFEIKDDNTRNNFIRHFDIDLTDEMLDFGKEQYEFDLGIDYANYLSYSLAENYLKELGDEFLSKAQMEEYINKTINDSHDPLMNKDKVELVKKAFKDKIFEDCLEIDEEGKKVFCIYDVGNLSFDSSDISKVIEKPNYEKLNEKLKESKELEKEIEK